MITPAYRYCYHGVESLYFKTAEYADGNLALEAMTGDGEAYATVSVNFPGVLAGTRDCICLDAENLPEETLRLLEKEGIIEYIGRSVLGDFGNTYPICRVNLEKFFGD